VRKHWARHVELDETIASTLHTNSETESQDAVDDFADRLKRGIKTTVDDERERDVQRWYVDSFIAGAFELRRHQCCDACMGAYQVGPSDRGSCTTYACSSAAG
jgi:hypothetical protein